MKIQNNEKKQKRSEVTDLSKCQPSVNPINEILSQKLLENSWHSAETSQTELSRIQMTDTKHYCNNGAQKIQFSLWIINEILIMSWHCTHRFGSLDLSKYRRKNIVCKWDFNHLSDLAVCWSCRDTAKLLAKN